MRQPEAHKSIKPLYFAFSITCALLLTLSFPPFNLSLFSYFAFLPLFFVINQTSRKHAFLFGYISGIIFFLTSLFWLTKVTVLGWITLCLYLGLYPAVFAILSQPILRSAAKGGRFFLPLLFIPCFWVATEFFRSHLFSGFGWNGLGYSQFKVLGLIQIADFSGVYGVSFLVMFFNCVLWLILINRKRIISLLLILALVLLAVLGYGILRLGQEFRQDEKSLRVAIIQPNIAQELKWNPGAADYIMEKLIAFTEQAARDRPDMIIWPESAIPFYFDAAALDWQVIFRLVEDLNIYLLTGVLRHEGNRFYNSAALIAPDGETLTIYDKLHLVPYGEFIPFREITPFLVSVVGIGDFSSGRDYRIFSLKEINFAVLICFEDAFPDLSRRFIKRGAQILINITNDGWFDAFSQPQQHVSQSVFRAIENRVNVLRCANTGISGMINANGKSEKFISDISGKETFISGFRTFKVNAKSRVNTPYTRYGDIFVYFCIGLCILAIKKR